jgi:hypothetical protein
MIEPRAVSLNLAALIVSKGRLLTLAGESNPPNGGRLHAQGLAILAIFTCQIVAATTKAASCRRHSGVSLVCVRSMLSVCNQYVTIMESAFVQR